jgi:hypothetical protein
LLKCYNSPSPTKRDFHEFFSNHGSYSNNSGPIPVVAVFPTVFSLEKGKEKSLGTRMQ